MYEFAYNSIVEDSSRAMRAQEARALDRVILQLREAEPAGPRSKAAINALYQLRTLWTVFLDDLNGADNALPTALRPTFIMTTGLRALRAPSSAATAEISTSSVEPYSPRETVENCVTTP